MLPLTEVGWNWNAWAIHDFFFFPIKWLLLFASINRKHGYLLRMIMSISNPCYEHPRKINIYLFQSIIMFCCGLQNRPKINYVYIFIHLGILYGSLSIWLQPTISMWILWQWKWGKKSTEINASQLLVSITWIIIFYICTIHSGVNWVGLW